MDDPGGLHLFLRNGTLFKIVGNLKILLSQ
jgi:hypothetical protein